MRCIAGDLRSPTRVETRATRDYSTFQTEGLVGSIGSSPARKYRRNLPHIQKAGRPILVTFRATHGFQLSPAARDIAFERCLQIHRQTALLHAAVVMPDHVHLLLTPIQDETTGEPFLLERILKAIKGTSARRINILLKRQGRLWQEESFDHILRTHESAEDKTVYIVQNPVRKGLVATSEEYRWLWRLSDERL